MSDAARKMDGQCVMDPVSSSEQPDNRGWQGAVVSDRTQRQQEQKE